MKPTLIKITNRIDIFTLTADVAKLQPQTRSYCGKNMFAVSHTDHTPYLPKFPQCVKLTHGLDHKVNEQMQGFFSNSLINGVIHMWFVAKNNVDQGIVKPQAAHAPQEKPFGHLQMDLVEGKKRTVW